MLIDNSADTVAMADALTAAYTEKNPDVNFDIEQRAGGGEGDNIVKTRLATGEMTDIFLYNSGSLFQALQPTRRWSISPTCRPRPSISTIFKPVVTAPDGKVYGVPFGAAMGGGILYNTKIYEELGLSVPKTWDEFMANNEKIKEAGKVPVIQTFATPGPRSSSSLPTSTTSRPRCRSLPTTTRPTRRSTRRRRRP